MTVRAVNENLLREEMLALGQAARAAARSLREASAATKTHALKSAAAALRARRELVLAANAKDIDAAKAGGMSGAMLDRLLLDDRRVSAMADGVDAVAALADPVGRELARWTRPNG